MIKKKKIPKSFCLACINSYVMHYYVKVSQKNNQKKSKKVKNLKQTKSFHLAFKMNVK